jgi:hypothetical protein
MSCVTDVIVVCGLTEESEESRLDSPVPTLERLSDWLEENEKGRLVRLDSSAGGRKAMQCVVALGAFNYLDIPDFLAHAWSLKWEDDEAVQIFIKDEEDDLFTAYRHGELPKGN